MSGKRQSAEGAGATKTRLDAALAALSTLLMVLTIGMIGTGVVWPGGEADNGAYAQGYEPIDPAAPIRLEIPSQDVVAAVWEIDIDAEGVLDPPKDATTVGWWKDSAAPGASTGQTVITGHTVHTGGGSLNHVGELEEGDIVDVVSNNGRMRYSVDRVRFYDRAEVAEQAEELFGQDRGEGGLVLISCADWNGEEYERNVVVFGTPLGQPEDGTGAATAEAAEAASPR